MEFLLIAYDGTDPDAKARRLDARQHHLDGVKALKDAGSFVNGGAILDSEGNMIGSTLYLDFPTRAELDRWLEQDPYVVRGVWKKIEVKPIRLVLRDS